MKYDLSQNCTKNGIDPRLDLCMSVDCCPDSIRKVLEPKLESREGLMFQSKTAGDISFSMLVSQ